MKKIVFMLAVAVALFAHAVEPKCEVKQEFWGHRYFLLTDVNGYTYKITPPTTGHAKYVTRTGWYIVDTSGKIVEFKDTGKKGK